MFPVQVCCGKGLIEKYLFSLYLTILVIIHGTLDLPQGTLQSNRSLRRGGVLMEIGWMPRFNGGCGVSTGRLAVCMGSIGLRKSRAVEAPEASRPDSTGVTVS
jgi:hypothetical protein